ncbi:ATP-binding cassette domain-containing protein [Spiractinospora alimapuensis]|uniref:ATP-binding cassette domain-containing protein n=1 Tax=Spiractinospora alimapuensis TaxID=2820884 RepID=UPI001F220E78|nr:ATP-binding cassette domain-containing protein [Spiractinospora alimapuensis]QVQ52548.1 ATP-binding cassette domain-containing protein [Spiractinospora alimapuensis]
MIHAQRLSRTFTVKGSPDPVHAVREIDLDIEAGELVALLGPNGAGKSTTLRMLTTLLTPTSGSARVAGYDVVTDAAAVRQNIGYIGQGNGAGHAHRVNDELVTQGLIFGLSTSESRRRSQEVLESLDLTDLTRRTVSELSGGQRRRLDIAIGLMHRPRLVFLDEPSTGLDPQNRVNLADHVRSLHRDHGTTVVLTTHYLEEADLLAERVIVVDQGRVIADDTPDTLKNDLAGDLVTITTQTPEDARSVLRVTERVGSPRETDQDGTTVRVRVSGGSALLPDLLRALDTDGVKVATAEVRRPTLDDVFLHLTGRSLREGETEDDQS